MFTKNYIFYFFTILFLSSCQSSESINNDNPLYYQQWSINYDSSFYAQNDIVEDANINGEGIIGFDTAYGVKIAIIDDGFDAYHPDIRNNVIKTISVDAYGSVSKDVSHTYESDHHGTAVSGIIGASNNAIGILGVASDAQLILIQMPEILSDDVTIKLFKQAVEAGADIISCSWGTYDVSDSVREYINYISTYARDGKGVIVVFASGNENADMGNDESSIKSVIGVGATGKDGLRTSYSNYGKALDIVAPGGEFLGISTLDPQGSDGVSDDEYSRYDDYYSAFIGTSASAPIVSGVIALALEKKSSLTREEIQELLKSSAKKVGLNTPYLDDMVSSSNTKPIITGSFGTNGYSKFYVRLTSSDTYKIYGLYDVYEKENNEWYAKVDDDLEEGNYIVEVIAVDENNNFSTLATDSEFEINSLKETYTDTTKRRSDFYGYGKIDLESFLDSI